MCCKWLKEKKSKSATLLYVCFVFWSHLAKARFFLSEGEGKLDGSEESVTVKLSHTMDNRIRRYTICGLPDWLNFDLYLREHYITLSLRHNHDIDVNRRVYVMERGKIVPHHVPLLQEIAFFQDFNSGAAVGVTCRRNTESLCEYQLEGVLSKGGNSYLIFPSDNDWTQQRNSTDSEFPHLIKQINESTLFSNDFIRTDSIWSHRRFQREKRAATKTSYNVELFMVTDSSVYRFWYDKQSIGSDAEKKVLTLDAIRQYYAFLINAVDMQYKNINETDISINVLFNGLLMLESPSQSPWTDGIAASNPSYPNLLLVDADNSLSTFTSWAQSRTDIPKSDHVMLFTAFDVVSNGLIETTGLAFIRGICTQNSTSISENFFDFKGVIVAAHELGHSLGAKHDGSANACSSGDRYIMAATSGGTSTENAQNLWHFSPCSINYFRNQIKALDDANNNCLLEERSDLDPTELAPLLQTRPGQFYSLDTQCEYALGKGSYVCRSLHNETTIPDICTGMYCFDPTNTSVCRRVYPATGSSCGDRKWCINSACVVDQNAPPKLESCFLGDDPGVVVNGLTCSELKDNRADLCYSDDVYNRCCASCNSIRTGIVDCAFGDRATNCGPISRDGCYNEKNGRLCCQTCDAYRTNIPGCEFGDRHPGCTSGSCGLNWELCCKTCYVPSTTKPTTSSPQPVASTPKPTTSTLRSIKSTPNQIASTRQPIKSTSKPIISTPKPKTSTLRPVTSIPQTIRSTKKRMSYYIYYTPSTPNPVTLTLQSIASTLKRITSSTQPTTSTSKPLTSHANTTMFLKHIRNVPLTVGILFCLYVLFI